MPNVARGLGFDVLGDETSLAPTLLEMSLKFLDSRDRCASPSFASAEEGFAQA
jgi:hypothetical protein